MEGLLGRTVRAMLIGDFIVANNLPGQRIFLEVLKWMAMVNSLMEMGTISPVVGDN